MRNTQPTFMFSAALLIVFGLVTPKTFVPASDEEKGLEIATAAEKYEGGFGDFSTDFRMFLKDKMGDRRERRGRIRTLEVRDDGDKMLLIIDAPPDVKGTVLLSYTHKVGPNDIWTYPSRLGRVKRVRSKASTNPFLRSEFSFEDLASHEVERYSHKYLRDETVDGRQTYLVERRPLELSGYSKQHIWYDKEDYRIWKIDFYDRKESLLKTLSYQNYTQYDDHYWRPGKMMMTNHQTGKATEFIFNNYQFRTGLTEADFKKNSLKRIR